MITVNEHSPSQKTIFGMSIVIVMVVLSLTVALDVNDQGILYLALGVFAFIAGIVLLSLPQYGVYLVILSFPFLASIPRGRYIPGLKLDELLIIVVMLAYLVGPDAQKFKITITRVDYVYLLMYLIGTVVPVMGVLFRGQNPDWIEVVALLKQFALYRLVLMTLSDRANVSRAIVLLLLSSLGVSLIALLQLLDFANVRTVLAAIGGDAGGYLLKADMRPEFYRATSTLGNWNALGGYAAFGCCLSLSLIWHCRNKTVIAWLASAAFVANFCTLAMSGSSSSIVGFISGALVLWLFSSGRKRAMIYIGVCIVLVLLVGIPLLSTVVGRVLHQQIQRQVLTSGIEFLGQHYPTYGLPRSVVLRWLLAKHVFSLMAEDGLALLTGFGAGRTGLDALSPLTTAESGYMIMLFFYGPLFLVSYLILIKVIASQACLTRKHLRNRDRLGYAVTMAMLSISVAMVLMNIIHAYYSAAGVTTVLQAYISESK